MKLNSLQLQNFRGFDSFELDLAQPVTLLVGRNACGKTAVLDAAAVALGAWMRGTTQAWSEDRSLQQSDARLVRSESDGLPTAAPVFPVAVHASGLVAGQQLTWTRELLRKGGRTTSGRAKRIRALARETERAASDGDAADLPLFAYYGTGRLWVQKRDKRRPGRLGSRMQGYAACLETASNTKLFQRWMAWREDDRIQRLAAAHEHGANLASVHTPHLDAVANAARSCLEGVRRFYYSANYRELRLELEDGRLLPFDSLSDGQRSLVVLAADIAWRAAQLNPHFGGDAPRRVEGVVLIDEVELHLHPAWQRRVIDDLTRTFPRLQFIITTHSPQVVATAEADWLRILTAEGVHRSDHVRGRDTNSILRDVMGVPDRPPWMVEWLRKVEVLVEQGRVDEAKTELTAIRALVGASDDWLTTLDWELQDLRVANPGQG